MARRSVEPAVLKPAYDDLPTMDTSIGCLVGSVDQAAVQLASSISLAIEASV
jgi:hypothetical protein